MTKSKTLCQGCRDDYYNQQRPDGCWNYEKATVVQRTRVGIWQPPPYKWLPQNTLSCHHPSDSCWIKEDDPRIKN